MDKTAFKNKSTLMVQSLFDRINALSVRERIWILIALLAMIYLVWSFLFWAPIYRKNVSFNTQINTLNVSIQNLQQQKKAFSSLSSEEQIKQSKIQLEDEIQRLNSEIQKSVKTIIPAKEMTQVLQDMFADAAGLKLVSLKNLQDQPLIQVSSGEKQASVSVPGFYKQGLQIVFEGDYFGTLVFLERLENLKWRIFFDQINYTVSKYPLAKITLTVHTLSFEREEK